MGTDTAIPEVETQTTNYNNNDAKQATGAPSPAAEEPPKIEDIITPAVLNSIIKGYKPSEPLEVLSFNAEIATKVGDNYLSIIYALDIHLQNTTSGEKETLNVMLKCIPRTEVRVDLANDLQVFKKEALIYEKVFPCLTEAQKHIAHLPDPLVFTGWPRSFASHVDGRSDFLAMENLRLQGYTTGDRKLGLDFNHCALVLRNLAKWHALSYFTFGGSREALLKAFPILQFNAFDKEATGSDMTEQFMKQSLRSQADYWRQKEGTQSPVSSRLDKLEKAELSKLMSSLVKTDIEHAVISHGDCWVNNLLFQYNTEDNSSGLPVQMKFIDFQICSATSRMVDVFHFLLTSAQLDMLAKCEEDLLMIYYSEFTSFAEMLGVDTKAKGLSWEAMLEEGAHYRFYGVCIGLLTAAMFSADQGDIPDMDGFKKEDMEGEEGMKKFYESISNEKGMIKAKRIVMEHLPKCKGFEQFL